MLEELSKEDQTWRQYALLICKDKELADDLVNDMYVKFYDRQIKEYTKSFVFRVLKNMFIDMVRKNRNDISLNDVYYIPSNTESNIEERKSVIDMLDDTLGLFHKEVLLITHEMSLREAEDATGVGYCKLNYHKQKALDILIKKYRDE